MAGLTLVKGLDELVAAMVVEPVNEVLRETLDDAKRLAPPTKFWISLMDGRERTTHHRAHNQEVPANLRFLIESMEWDREHRGVGAITYMLRPHDGTSHAVANIANCRCFLAHDNRGVSKLISRTQAVQVGPLVQGKVVAEGDWVVQAEYGDTYPGVPAAEGAYFMTLAAQNTASRRRARR